MVVMISSSTRYLPVPELPGRATPTHIRNAAAACSALKWNHQSTINTYVQYSIRIN